MRIMIGLPVALLTLAAVTPNFYEKPALGNLLSDRPRAQTAVPATADAPETDNSLVKTGWYGELQYDGLLLIVSAYEENAVESKQFNSRLPKPVSYATLTVINLGNPTPVVLSKLQVGIHLTGGEVVQSLPIKPLLDHNADVNSDLIKRLALPLQLAIGGMLPDIPICMESGFSWSRVSAVTVPLGVQELSVRGRVMTAEEKKTMLEKSKSSRSASDGKGAAETWFKNL